MSKTNDANESENALTDGLEAATTTTETTTDATTTDATTKVKKEQTPEELAVITAGIAKIKEFGVSEKFAKVMDTLCPAWNDTDKDTLTARKEEVIKEFGGSEALKDYVDTDFQKELQAIQGTAKVASILNNIKSFYARRTSTGKTKTVQVNISGTLYNVDAAYYAEISSQPKDVKKELLLAHAGTVEATNICEIL